MVRIKIGSAVDHDQVSEFDHYLTARFGLWAPTHGILTHTRAHHPQWPLHRATVLDVEDRLVTAAGLTAPTTEPIAHFSRGVPVRIGYPRPVKRCRTGA